MSEFIQAPHWNPHQPSTDGEPLNPFLNTPPAGVEKPATASEDALIDRLVKSALSRDDSCLTVTVTEHISVAQARSESVDYGLSDGTESVPLGSDDYPHIAIVTAVQLMGKAMDKLVVASKDTRLVALYEAYKRTPDPEQVLDALWGIMTGEERNQADVSRAFDAFRRPDEDGPLSEMLNNSENPEEGISR